MAIAATIDNDTGLCIMSNLKPPGTKRQICTDSTLSLGFEHLEESEDAADCIQKSAIILCWNFVYTSKPSVSRADPTCAETVVVVAICGPGFGVITTVIIPTTASATSHYILLYCLTEEGGERGTSSQGEHKAYIIVVKATTTIRQQL